MNRTDTLWEYEGEQPYCGKCGSRKPLLRHPSYGVRIHCQNCGRSLCNECWGGTPPVSRVCEDCTEQRILRKAEP